MKINGKYLEEFLDSHNLSPEKLGKKLDISGEAVRKIIRTESTKESTIRRICSALDMDMAMLSPQMASGLNNFDFATKEKGMLERITELEEKYDALSKSILDLYQRLPK